MNNLFRLAVPLLALLALVAGAAGPAPPTIHLNQIGFLPDTIKRAVVASVSQSPLVWRLRDSGGRTVADGRTRVLGPDEASGDHVHLIAFDTVRAPGEYRLEVAGTVSRPFPIRADVYAPLARASLNFFYHQRAGTPIEARYAGSKTWARPAGHVGEVAACFTGADQRGTIWPGCPYTLDVTGGWYDAGDHGKYVVNGGIALWTLHNLHETTGGAFADGSAAMPEAGNRIDDLLDEARWQMDFLLKMQVPDGSRLALPIGKQGAQGPLRLTQVDAGGMAHHKVADRNWTKLPTAPADDREDRLLYPPSTAATLNLAAVAAQSARLWRTIDPAFSRRCLQAAERAWKAALRLPDVYAAQAFTGSGGYGDSELADEFAWAAAELYATTGGSTYRRALAPSTAVEEPSWASVAALGTITLAVAPDVPASERDAARASLVAAADRFMVEGERSGYRIPFAATSYRWGSNSDILNRAMILALAERFTGEARYRDAVVDAADYVLGRNPLDQSYVSGFGWQPLMNPHHRFWARQIDPNTPGPPPGVLSGGPNSTSFADPLARKMKGKCAPQRCWVDDIGSFAMNEVAINWNAPLVWVATVLSSQCEGPLCQASRRGQHD